MAKQAGNWIAKFKQDLVADKKKTGVLGGLMLVLLVSLLWLAESDDTPSEVTAQPVAPIIAAASNPATAPRIRPIPQAVVSPTMKKVLARGEAETTDRSPMWSRPAGQRRNRTKTVPVSDMSRTLTRNIFASPSWSLFPREITLQLPGPSDVEAGKSRPSLLSQFGALLAAQQAQRAEETKAIDEAFSQLKLQSTMTGRQPLAYVSGRLVGVGDTIHEFSVVRIEDKRVILRKGSFKRELTMP